MSSSANDNTDDDDDDANPPLPVRKPAANADGVTKCASEIFYEAQGRSLVALAVMCRGLKNDEGKQILNLDDDCWMYLKVPRAMKPKASDYKTEVARRWDHFVTCSTSPTSIPQRPQPKAWLIAKLEKWLDDYPINDPNDVLFLTKAAKDVTAGSMLVFNSTKAEKALLEKSWTGTEPQLRLIHCLVDNDEIKSAFLTRNHVSTSRMAVENRNSKEKRPKSVWELLAEEWNNPNFAPETEEIQGLHSNFNTTQTLSHDLVSKMAPATPEKCQRYISSMIVELGRVIRNWEASGQGDGGVVEEGERSKDNDNNDWETSREYDGGIERSNNNDADSDNAHDNAPDGDNGVAVVDYGSFKNRFRGALDMRHSFVQAHQSYILYFWHMLEKHDLMRTSISKFDGSVIAENGRDVPSTKDQTTSTTTSTVTTADGNCRSNANSDMVLHLTQKLSESIEKLGDKNLSMARIDVEQRERERQTKEKEIEIKERKMTQSRLDNLRAGIDRLRAEKRKLSIQLFQNKRDKTAVEFFTNEIKEINRETDKKESEFERESELLGRQMK